MKTTTQLLLLLGAAWLCASQAIAEEVFQSVTKEGEVIYSDRPATDAVEVKTLKTAPEPTAAEVEESRKRAERMAEEAGKAGQQREAAAAGKQAEIEAARQRVKQAEARLREAEVVREGDRIGKAGGGSRLSPGYLARVEAAKAELEAAKKALKLLRSR